MTIPQLIDFYGSRGFGAIAITDHICETETLIGQAAHYFRKTLTEDNFAEYLEIIWEQAHRAWCKYRMVVIPGFELSQNFLSEAKSAHIVALNCTQFVPAHGEVRKMAQAIRCQGGLSIAAHPVSTGKWEKQTRYLWNHRAEFRDLFDAWEVASGIQFSHEVMSSGLPMLASSDLHVSRQINSWKTVFECERHVDAICEAIRVQQLSFQFYNEPYFEVSPRRTAIYDLILNSVRTTDLAVW